jgi:hypothetical protein
MSAKVHHLDNRELLFLQDNLKHRDSACPEVSSVVKFTIKVWGLGQAVTVIDGGSSPYCHNCDCL